MEKPYGLRVGDTMKLWKARDPPDHKMICVYCRRFTELWSPCKECFLRCDACMLYYHWSEVHHYGETQLCLACEKSFSNIKEPEE